MSQLEEFHGVYEEVNVFRRNLSKDNAERRLDIAIVKKYFSKLERIKSDFQLVGETFNKGSHEPDIVVKAQKYLENIVNKINSIEQTLQDRLDDINSQSAGISKNNTMGEKFDLKTAAAMLPQMDNTENVTKQLIDCIELYNDLLDADGKVSLTKYVLKVRLSQSAKMRLNNTYASNEALVEDMRRHLLTQRSASALAVKLNTARQNGRSIEIFGKYVEDLCLQLTISQAKGDPAVEGVLRQVNEPLAINAFSSGLQSNDLRTIIKARNYASLAQAITAAKDEDVKREPQPVFHMRNRGRNFSRGFRANRFQRTGYNSYTGNNSYNTAQNNQSNNSYGQNQNRQNTYRNNASGTYRNNNNQRGRGSHRGNYRGAHASSYHMNAEDTGSTEKFFRDPETK